MPLPLTVPFSPWQEVRTWGWIREFRHWNLKFKRKKTRPHDWHESISYWKKCRKSTEHLKEGCTILGSILQEIVSELVEKRWDENDNLRRYIWSQQQDERIFHIQQEYYLQHHWRIILVDRIFWVIYEHRPKRIVHIISWYYRQVIGFFITASSSIRFIATGSIIHCRSKCWCQQQRRGWRCCTEKKKEFI